MKNEIKADKKKLLLDVHITKNDTCLTYVLKRLGLPMDYCSYITLHDKFSYYSFIVYENKRCKNENENKIFFEHRLCLLN